MAKKKNEIKKKGSGLKIERKRFVDELFLNGFDRSSAYMHAYPNVRNREIARKAAHRLLTNVDEVKDYYNWKMLKYRESIEIDSQKMIDSLMGDINLFNELKILASKSKLTAEEESRFMRISMILKASDANKARDMINKLQGNYQAEKHEIKVFKEQPLFNFNNKDVEDVDFKEDDK